MWHSFRFVLLVKLLKFWSRYSCCVYFCFGIFWRFWWYELARDHVAWTIRKHQCGACSWMPEISVCVKLWCKFNATMSSSVNNFLLAQTLRTNRQLGGLYSGVGSLLLIVTESPLRVIECVVCAFIAWGAESDALRRKTGTWKKLLCSWGAQKFVYCLISLNEKLKMVLNLCEFHRCLVNEQEQAAFQHNSGNSSDDGGSMPLERTWVTSRFRRSQDRILWKTYPFCVFFSLEIGALGFWMASISQSELRNEFENRHFGSQKTAW